MLAGSVGLGVCAHAADNNSTEKDKAADVARVDVLIFKDGTRIEGTILSETDTEITVRISHANISTDMTYEKAKIAEIKRNTAKHDDSHSQGTLKIEPKKDEPKKIEPKKPEPAKVEPKKDDANKEGEKKGEVKYPGTGPIDSATGKIIASDGTEVPAGNMKVYVVDIRGSFGRNFTRTPIKQVMDEIVKVQPEVVVFRYDANFSDNGQGVSDFGQLGFFGAFDQLETARELETLIIDRVNTSPEFKTKPRMVAWIRKAMGGAAFLPCAFPEMYFFSDGLHGGIGGLEAIFGDTGDYVVREKQRSLRLGRARGLAEKGGHNSIIIEAMARRDGWLCYKLEGGKAILAAKKPDSPEWILLKDDGMGAHADTMQDVVRMNINDYLLLKADTAKIIGWSKGTADSLDDLLFRMNIERNYSVVRGQSTKYFVEWESAVSKAESEIVEFLDKFREVTVKQPAGVKERNAARSQQIKILQDVNYRLEKYQEAINPDHIRAWPEGLGRDLRLVINNLKLAIAADR